MRVLNLYAGIGGNRKLWKGCEVTAVEKDEQIAAIYKTLYPKDTVIIGDAHSYLIERHKDFDFVWSSPPCPTHSRTNYFLTTQRGARYPDMTLYEEIIFLSHFFEGKYCVENVISYYEPLIKPQLLGRHYLWTNFTLPRLKIHSKIGAMGPGTYAAMKKNLEGICIDLTGFTYSGDKDRLLRNCVSPDIGKVVLDRAMNISKAAAVQTGLLF